MTNQRDALADIRERAYRLARINCPDDCCDWTHPLCWIARTADAALKGVPLPASPPEPAGEPAMFVHEWLPGETVFTYHYGCKCGSCPPKNRNGNAE